MGSQEGPVLRNDGKRSLFPLLVFKQLIHPYNSQISPDFINMAKVKGFADIGKQAGDLLGKGFDFKNTFSFATSAHDGTKINVKSIKDGEKLSGEVKFNAPMSGIPVDVTITSAAKVSMSASKSGLVDGMKATLAGSLP